MMNEGSNRGRMMGIYQIMNSETGECYVGSSRDVPQRFHDHLCKLVDGVHESKLLQQSWQGCPPSTFQFSILEIVNDPKKLGERELVWIKKTGAVERGFNTKSDQYRSRTHVSLHMETKMMLEDLEMGSMNSTLMQLIKFYKKYQ